MRALSCSAWLISASTPNRSCMKSSTTLRSRFSTMFSYASGASWMTFIPRNTLGTTRSAITASTSSRLAIFSCPSCFLSHRYTGWNIITRTMLASR